MVKCVWICITVWLVCAGLLCWEFFANIKWVAVTSEVIWWGKPHYSRNIWWILNASLTCFAQDQTAWFKQYSENTQYRTENRLLSNKSNFRWHSFRQRFCVILCRNLAGYWIIYRMQAVHSAFLFGISQEMGLLPEESPCHGSETEVKGVPCQRCACVLKSRSWFSKS